jgi:type IV secretion system protein VirD4
MMKSLAARVLYAPKDFAEANEISQELGFMTVRVKSLSQPRATLFSTKAHRQGSVSISDQKRPLMLPQEVKELGRDREILLYEGLRPVLAWKNRYYEDRFFRKRLFPPPARAAPAAALAGHAAPSAPLRAAAAANVDGLTPAAPGIEVPKPATRYATDKDLERIEQLTLQDFNIDFDKVVLPQKAEGERFTTEELDTAVQTFINALRER